MVDEPAFNFLSAGNCRRFIWGGCQGNDNNFASQQLCTSTCAAVMATRNSRTGLQASPAAAWAPVPWNTQQVPDAWIVDGTAKQAPAPQASSAAAVGGVGCADRVMGVLLLAVLLACVIAP
jgi:hypothetical protein